MSPAHGRGVVLLVAALCVWAGAALLSGPADAQPVPMALMEPTTDAGVIHAGARQGAATCFTCPTARTKAVSICNPLDSDQNPGSVSVRVGGPRVKAWPANKKNGLMLAAGACMSLPLGGDGRVCVISDSAADGGSMLGVVCSEGGP